MLKELASLFDLEGRLSRGGLHIGALCSLPYYLWVMWMQLQVMPQQRFEPLFLLAPLGVVWLFALVRRLHDRGRSGWWLLAIYGLPVGLGFVGALVTDYLKAQGQPEELVMAWIITFGSITLIPMLWGAAELLVLRGNAGQNRYGPNPIGARS